MIVCGVAVAKLGRVAERAKRDENTGNENYIDGEVFVYFIG